MLIGEASHGTHEFYRERARITRRLIDEHGFTAVAVEADWPDAYRVNRYVMGLSHDVDADIALSRLPALPDVDVAQPATSCSSSSGCAPATTRTRTRRRKARFYGLDLYSLQASIEAVIGYLDRVDPAEARRARDRYSCFDHVGREGQAYGYALAYERAIPCENEVVAQLVALRSRADAYLRRDGWIAEDELFFAEQNARVVRDAEEYYQQMYRAEVSSWNLRDRHMADTLDALVEHLDRQLGRAKIVVWEHNSHVGDARATAMGARGELNVGQLARQRYGERLPARRLHHSRRSRHGRHRLGRRRRAQARAAGAPRQLRGAPPRGRPPSFWLDTADRGVARRAARPPARARDRRDLPTRDRASEPLLRRSPRRPVRRGDPLRPHPGARAARTHLDLGSRRATRDLPDGGVRCSRTEATPVAGWPPGWPVCRSEHLVVLGLPRGGVPVAFEVAAALGAPLDVIVVRKLGVPYQPELAMGAIGEDGVRIVNEDVVRRAGVTAADFAAVEARERRRARARARARFRGAHDRVPLAGRTALVVDDGIATGSTVRAACEVARAHGAARVIVAAPVAPPERGRAPARRRRRGRRALEPARRSTRSASSTTTSRRPPTTRSFACSSSHARHAVDARRGPATPTAGRDEEVEIDAGPVRLAGHLTIPERRRRRRVVRARQREQPAQPPQPLRGATCCNRAGLGTLLFDLLTAEEERDRANVFDIELLAQRLVVATRWLREQPRGARRRDRLLRREHRRRGRAVGGRRNPSADVAAVVSRGGRPDLAGARASADVRAPTLLIVGGDDTEVLELNREARARMRCETALEIVPGATHLFEEPGTLADGGRARSRLVRQPHSAWVRQASG